MLSQNLDLITDSQTPQDLDDDAQIDPESIKSPEKHMAELLNYKNQPAIKSFFDMLRPQTTNPNMAELLSAMDEFKGGLTVNLKHVSHNETLKLVNEIEISLHKHLAKAVELHKKDTRARTAQGQALHNHIFKGDGDVAEVVPLMEMMYNSI